MDTNRERWIQQQLEMAQKDLNEDVETLPSPLLLEEQGLESDYDQLKNVLLTPQQDYFTPSSITMMVSTDFSQVHQNNPPHPQPPYLRLLQLPHVSQLRSQCLLLK